MKVVVANATPFPEVEASLRARVPPDELVLADVSGSPTDYWRLIADLWAEQRDFVLVEHDVVLAPGTIASFEECPEIWCSAPSKLGNSNWKWAASCLQCNRWRAEALELYPDLLQMPAWCRHWSGLDALTLPRLERKIGPAHVHADFRTVHLGADRSPAEAERRSLEFHCWLAQFAPPDDVVMADVARQCQSLTGPAPEAFEDLEEAHRDSAPVQLIPKQDWSDEAVFAERLSLAPRARQMARLAGVWSD